MNRILTSALSIAIFTMPALCQPRPKNGASAKPKILKKGAPVPEGFVVVGESETSKTIKKPGAHETVCSGSPVPEGYSAVRLTSSEECSAAGINPLTNAMIVARDGEAEEDVVMSETTSHPRRAGVAPPAEDGEEATELNLLIEQRAAEENRKAQLSLASMTGSVMVGMTMKQVFESWGRPAEIREHASSISGTTVTWRYRRGRAWAMIEFRNGLVSYFSANY